MRGSICASQPREMRAMHARLQIAGGVLRGTGLEGGRKRAIYLHTFCTSSTGACSHTGSVVLVHMYVCGVGKGFRADFRATIVAACMHACMLLAASFFFRGGFQATYYTLESFACVVLGRLFFSSNEKTGGFFGSTQQVRIVSTAKKRVIVWPASRRFSKTRLTGSLGIT